MSGKIIVHIGLPKTATTTLQTDFFPRFSRDSIKYLGVFQPRDEGGEGFFYQGFRAAIYGEESVQNIRQHIELELMVGNTLIISEEMITVSQGRCSWRDKLRNLAAILRGFDYQLIVSVREPCSAIFSYYVEIHHEFSCFRSFSDVALNDERMEIYHYGKLSNELLEEFDRDRIIILKFEDIISGNLDGVGKKISSNYTPKEIIVRNLNKREGESDFVMTATELTLLNILRRNFVWKIIKRNDALVRFLRTVSFGRRKIFRPSRKDMSRLALFMSEEKSIFEREFGVTFDK